MTSMRWVKSPCRTRSVPMNSSWIELVIERASARPIAERDHLDDQEQHGDEQQDHDRPLAERAAAKDDLLRVGEVPIELRRL